MVLIFSILPLGQSKRAKKKHGGVPDKSLTPEQVEKLSGEDCLDLIEERHGLLAETLFSNSTVPAPTHETGKWDRENLPKVALMRLEGFTLKNIADFFSQEFSALHRTDKLVSEDTVGVIMSSYFSPALKGKINEHAEERALGGIFLSENRDLILKIENKTGLKGADLFSDRKLYATNQGATFSLLELIRAFDMRLENKPYKEILTAFGKTYSPDSPLLLRLRVQINRTFSEAARRFLPKTLGGQKRKAGGEIV